MPVWSITNASPGNTVAETVTRFLLACEVSIWRILSA